MTTAATMRDYRLRQKRQWAARNRELVPMPRRERWTQAEDAVIIREDITTREKAVILQRSYQAVAARGWRLRDAPLVECGNCKKLYRRCHADGQFCSHSCAAQVAAVTTRKPENICETCGSRDGSRHNTRFCSHACRRKIPERLCETCGNQFRRSDQKGRPARFCSMACRRASRLIDCLYCGRQIKRKDSETRFCSKSCVMKHRYSTRAPSGQTAQPESH
jgi:hypothetical protein